MGAPAQSYVLCSNPRSGTTLLCTMLRDCGVAGAPDSFFREKSLQDWCNAWGITAQPDRSDPAFTRTYFDALLKAGRADTAMFGLRLMGPDLGLACDWLARRHPGLTSDLAGFDMAFGPVRFIHLSRQDKLAEAVSYLRAEQTGLWHQNADGSALERIVPTERDGFDADRLTQRLGMLQDYDNAWEKWFKAERISPLRLTYEELAADPRATLAKVLRFLHLDPKIAKTVPIGLRKLADEVSTDWIARYRHAFPGS